VGTAMLLRFFGYICLCIALAAAAFDGTRMIADKVDLASTALIEHWQMIDAQSLATVQGAVEQLNPYVWSPLLMTVLVLPTWMVAGCLGIFLYMAGYRRPRPTLPDGI
jgi:hypothetical protein